MFKELEALNKIGEKWTSYWNNGLGHSYQIKELDDYKIIETALKALEIIKNKVGIHWEEILSIWLRNKLITQEEYDLLKEVLL